MSDPAPARLLRSWLDRQAPPSAVAWLDEKAAAIADDASSRALAMALGMAPRKIGKAALELTAEDRREAHLAHAGWTPDGMSLDQVARIWLLLKAAPAPTPLASRLRAILATADVGEAVAIYRGLPLYPASPDLVSLAVDGLRTSMRDVFEAVANDSPFPAEHFSDDAWAQMVLKALFVGTSLDRIQGLDRRWTADLARKLVDYARERRAARRSVNPELWRGVGRFADDAVCADLAAVLRTGSAVERAAAALALSESQCPAAAAHLASDAELQAAARSGAITWAAIAKAAAGEAAANNGATQPAATVDV